MERCHGGRTVEIGAITPKGGVGLILFVVVILLVLGRI
ncbi:MAG: DUF3309 family protein [Candidatus Sulfotelmatobacter sp.]